MNKHLVLAYLHPHVGIRTLREAALNFPNTDGLSLQETIDCITPILSPKEPGKTQLSPQQLHALDDLEYQLEAAGVTVIAIGDELYPQPLLEFKSPPPILYVKGDTGRFRIPGIGICGSRKASETGLKQAETIGAITSDVGTTLISGYARGVDEWALVGSLRAGGKSIAVLAEGILHFRLKGAFREFAEVENAMAIVSEFPPTKPWHVWSAMKRNDTILGLSQAMVAIEAGEKGGTMDAGMKCLRRKKPLWIPRFRDMSATPPGSDRLIALGGIAVNSSEELRSLIQTAGLGSSQRASARVPQTLLPI